MRFLGMPQYTFHTPLGSLHADGLIWLREGNLNSKSCDSEKLFEIGFLCRCGWVWAMI
jgi:hypothetical protein